MRAEIVEICMKTKWTSMERLIFKLNRFQCNMAQIIRLGKPCKKVYSDMFQPQPIEDLQGQKGVN